jgi:hypothetical protein
MRVGGVDTCGTPDVLERKPWRSCGSNLGNIDTSKYISLRCLYQDLVI